MYGLQINVAFNQLRSQSACFFPRYRTPLFPSMAYQFEASEDEGVMEERAASIMVLFFARAFLKRCLASVHAKRLH